MANIREDVVQISFDIDDSPLNDLIEEMNKLKDSLDISQGIDGVSDIVEELSDITGVSTRAAKDVEDLATI